MNTLIKGYESTIAQLESRISEIKVAKEKMEVLCKRKRGDPELEQEIPKMEQRLKVLNDLRRDMKLVTKEVSQYYDMDHWRDEDLTMNQMKIRSQPYAPVYLDDAPKK